MPVVKKIVGSQGSWDVRVFYTDGTTEIMPTAHKEFFKGDRYERGGPDDVTWKQYTSRPRYQKHVELLKQTKRVAVTFDHFDHDAGIWHRDGYSGAFDIDDIKANDAGLSFRFVNRLKQQ
jgi:hypothetical protein